jgi:hypothetical protein
MTHARFFYSIVILYLLSACDAYHKRLVGPYILDAVDSEEALNVAYDDGSGLFSYRIGPTVTDVGWDEHYIAAAVRPEGSPRGTPPVFYYLDIKRDSHHPTGGQFAAVVGPLSKEQFDAARTSLNLPGFRLHFPKLR